MNVETQSQWEGEGERGGWKRMCSRVETTLPHNSFLLTEKERKRVAQSFLQSSPFSIIIVIIVATEQMTNLTNNI